MFDVIEWYFGLPLLMQLIIGIAIAAIIVLVLIGVYYLLKGTGNLINSIFKGIGFIFYGFFHGIYLLFEGLYYLITGKTKKPKQESSTKAEEKNSEDVQVTDPEPKVPQDYVPEVKFYCSECGTKFSDKMAYLINSKGIAFCECCGKEFRLDETNHLS